MNQKKISSALFAIIGALSAYSWDMPSIIGKVSGNCDSIMSYTADADVRYHI